MAPPPGERTRVVVSPDQVSAAVADEIVILAMQEGVYYGLDSVAARIWALMQEPRELGDIATTLEAEFDVTRERALADLIALADALVAHGLIEVVPAATPA